VVKQEVLILAMTYMRSGICTAGLTKEYDPITHLRWVRPVKEHGSVLLGDMADAQDRVVECFDVVEMALQQPRPDPPHTEDVLTDFVYHRPRLLRRLEGEHRADFLAKHLDCSPEDVIVHHRRSLCLVRPAELWACFSLDPWSGKYEARLGFELSGVQHDKANSPKGVPVTDLRWRALGRSWLGCAASTEPSSELVLRGSELMARLQARDIYLVLGLSRGYQNDYWLLVVGVHAVPDYDVTVDYTNL
jgi:hypothetical protein